MREEQAPETKASKPRVSDKKSQAKQADPREAIVDYLPDLRAFAMSLVRNPALADDLVQDTVVKAWINFEKFDLETNMRAWLFTILRNTFYSHRRKIKREVSDADGLHASKLATKPAHDGRLQLRDFLVAFDTLPPQQREALVLVGASGFSYEEAAEMCGVALGTIKSRVNRGRTALAKHLALRSGEEMELTDGTTLAVLTASETPLA
ncbi:MAG: RNA polymerase sigma factor [Paracoccaceae bacterium]